MGSVICKLMSHIAVLYVNSLSLLITAIYYCLSPADCHESKAKVCQNVSC